MRLLNELLIWRSCPGPSFVAVAVVICIAGCGGISTSYQVEIRPTDDGYLRTVEVTSSGLPPAEQGQPEPPATSAQEQAIFAAIYGEGMRVADAQHFERGFASETPDDVGGRGALVRWTSELGDVLVYHERFRGELPKLQDRLVRQAAIDQLVQWLLGWLDEELAGIEGAGEMQRFVDRELRRDFQDLNILLEVIGSQAVDTGAKDQTDDLQPAMLLSHFLIERDYLSVSDVAGFPLLTLSEDAIAGWLSARLRGRIVRATGLAVDAPALAMLDDPAAMLDRLGSYLRRTPEYQALQQQREAAADGAAATGDLMEQLLGPAINPLLACLFFQRDPDHLVLTLHSTVEPIETNGTWNPQTRSVHWEWRLASRPGDPQDARAMITRLPKIAIAVWAIPDQGMQNALFGEVLIEGEELQEYGRWQKTLTPEQAAAWGELLRGMPAVPVAQRAAALQELGDAWAAQAEPPPVLKRITAALLEPKEG